MIGISIIIAGILIADAIRQVNGIQPWLNFGTKKLPKD